MSVPLQHLPSLRRAMLLLWARSRQIKLRQPSPIEKAPGCRFLRPEKISETLMPWEIMDHSPVLLQLNPSSYRFSHKLQNFTQKVYFMVYCSAQDSSSKSNFKIRPLFVLFSLFLILFSALLTCMKKRWMY